MAVTPHVRRWPVLAALLCVPLLALWRALLLGETFFYQDLAGQYFPREALLRRTGLTGWNPHILLGMGLAGDPQSAVYEPVRALGRALGMSDARSFVMFLAVYLTVAAIGVFAFASRRGASPLGAALAVLGYVWGGLFVVRFRHPWAFGGIALLPWALYFADRFLEGKRLTDALLIAMAIALGTLSGHPQVPYITWLLVVAWCALGVRFTVDKGQRARTLMALAWRLAVAGLCFAGLLAFYYAPVVALLMKSARSSGGIAFAGSYSFNPWDWVRLLGPDLYGNDMAGTHWGTRNYHEQMSYVGIAPLLLVAVAAWWRAPRERSLCWIALAAFLLAAGRFLPPFYVAYYLVPGFKLFRCPARYNIVFALAAATVAGLVLTRIAEGERPSLEDARRIARRLAWLCGPLVVLCVAAAIVAAVLGARMDRAVGQEGAHVSTLEAALRAAVLLVATAGVIILWLRARIDGRRAAFALFAVTVVDLAAQWLPYRQTEPPALAFPAPAIVDALAAADRDAHRVIIFARQPDGGPAIAPLLNWGEAARYDDVRGYNQGVSPELLALYAAGDRAHRTLEEPHDLAVVDPEEWLLDLTGTARLAAPIGQMPEHLRALPIVASEGGWEVRERRGALPRAWLVSAVEVRDVASALAQLPSLDARAVAIVDRDVGLPSVAAGDAGRVTITRRDADDLTLDAEALVPSLLVLADRFDAGWSATVDGAVAPIVRADAVLRGVRLTPGRHEVRFHYTVPARALGRTLTLATLPLLLLLLCAGAIVARYSTRKASKRSTSPQPHDHGR